MIDYRSDSDNSNLFVHVRGYTSPASMMEGTNRILIALRKKGAKIADVVFTQFDLNLYVMVKYFYNHEIRID